MQVHVVMGIRVIEGQAGGLKGLELGPNFRSQLPPDAGQEKISKTGAHQITVEQAVFIDEIGNAFRGQHRFAPDDDEVQSNP